MFREMRRIEKMLSKEKINNILENTDYGVLCTISANGYPYGVPINYYYDGENIYIHSARTGEKIDNIIECKKVSFSVVGKSEVVPNKFSTDYESVIVFGEALEIEKEEKTNALLGLIKKYSPDFYEEGEKYVNRAENKTKVIKIKINHITGKGNKE